MLHVRNLSGKKLELLCAGAISCFLLPAPVLEVALVDCSCSWSNSTRAERPVEPALWCVLASGVQYATFGKFVSFKLELLAVGNQVLP
jgi:hypothetical protein